MKYSSGLYFSIQGVFFPRRSGLSTSANIKITYEGSDLVETFSSGPNKILRYRYKDANIGYMTDPLDNLEPSQLTDQIPEDLIPYAPTNENSSFALFRVTMTSHLIYSKKGPYTPVWTQIDILLDNSGVGAYRICNANNGTLFELAPYAVARMPIAVMMTIPTWLPEFLKVALIAFIIWKIKGALLLSVIPWTTVFLLILALIAFVAFLISEILTRMQASGGLTPAQNAALQNALRLKKMAEQRKEVIERAGGDLTPAEVQQIQDMLNEITDTANELGETLNPDSEDAEELKEVSENLEKLQEDLEEALPD